MITGTVARRRPFVDLVVRGPSGQEGEVEFVLDTGFTGMMTLPPAACAALGLPFDRLQPSFLADGTQVMLEVYLATIPWEGEELTVEILGMDGAPLVGMSLLDGHEVRIQVTDGGLVTIEPL